MVRCNVKLHSTVSYSLGITIASVMIASVGPINRGWTALEDESESLHTCLITNIKNRVKGSFILLYIGEKNVG